MATQVKRVNFEFLNDGKQDWEVMDTFITENNPIYVKLRNNNNLVKFIPLDVIVIGNRFGHYKIYDENKKIIKSGITIKEEAIIA